MATTLPVALAVTRTLAVLPEAGAGRPGKREPGAARVG